MVFSAKWFWKYIIYYAPNDKDQSLALIWKCWHNGECLFKQFHKWLIIGVILLGLKFERLDIIYLNIRHVEKDSKKTQKFNNNDPSSYVIKINYYTKKSQDIEKKLHIFFYFIIVAWQVNNDNNSKIYCVFFKVEFLFQLSCRRKLP